MPYIPDDLMNRFLQAVVLIAAIRALKELLSERQLLRVFDGLIEKYASLTNTRLRYTYGRYGRRTITAEPATPEDEKKEEKAQEKAGAHLSVLRTPPDGQPERRQHRRRHSDPEIRGSPGSELGDTTRGGR